MNRALPRLAIALMLLAARASVAHADYIKIHEHPGSPQPAAKATPAAADAPPRIIYLSRKGGTYTSADHDDSTQNLSGALHFGDPGKTEIVAPWSATDAQFAQTLACSQAMWGRFNVRVTDVDPGSTPHIEAVLTGSKNVDIGFSGGTGGIALLDCDTPVSDNAVVWIFPEIFGSNPQRTCEVIAQEVGHTIQLDHELLCKDPMTYLTDCQDRSFQDADAGCHDMNLKPAPCACTGFSSQNSVRSLLTRLGPGETQPPTVTIQSPAASASVAPGFTVQAEATDDYAVLRNEIWLDGTLESTVNSLADGWKAPRTIGVGTHHLEIRSFDPNDNMGTATVDFSVAAECTTAADCGDSKLCTDGVCFSDLGVACTSSDECASEQCALDATSHRLCTKACAGAADCPSGFSCDRVGVSAVLHCWPSSDSGGCALGDASRASSDRWPLGAAVVTFATFVALRPRRRRR